MAVRAAGGAGGGAVRAAAAQVVASAAAVAVGQWHKLRRRAEVGSAGHLPRLYVIGAALEPSKLCLLVEVDVFRQPSISLSCILSRHCFRLPTQSTQRRQPGSE